ncbi:hypothetical protein SAMN05421806_11533 [Streptomyces indicus]|uniref:Uncharacterized protein n=1 Tax=Streptomyces indicus TaxID=417292 RepID=A0A1G9G8V6_9ACTN|nr:hypothetical protein SAMN05421806_11533 [Streptomyces indicus]
MSADRMAMVPVSYSLLPGLVTTSHSPAPRQVDALRPDR